MTTFTHLPSPAAPARLSGRAAETPGARHVEPSPFRWSSGQLFGGGQEVQIAHGESIYRLRITSLGKLILTK